MALDKHIARLQNQEPFDIYSVGVDGAVSPWYLVDGYSLVVELVIQEQNLAEQVQIVSAQIAHWGRHASQCQRVLNIEERHYRAWRSQFYLDARSGKRTFKDVDEGGKPKIPTKEEIEAMYRVAPEYDGFQTRIERAREAYEACKEVVNAFKAKRDMLRTAVWRAGDGSVQMSV